MGNHEAVGVGVGGYPQNAGVLVVLVGHLELYTVMYLDGKKKGYF